jgi:glycosyltransferase involved in cell wall biosynthesis
MKIGIVQRDDTRNVLSSSGTIYSMSQSLERHVGEVVHLGPDRSLTGKAIIRAGQVFNRLSEPILGRRISPIHRDQLARHAAKVFGSRIAEAHCDILYAPFASVEIVALSTRVPIVYHTDMTWAQGVNYYSIYSNLFETAREQGERLQRKALEKAALSIFPSEWTAKSATGHYGISPEKVHVVSYGANFAAADVPPAQMALNHSLDSGVKLLWIGVDWERKGGVAAYQCFLDLLERGVDASLAICGCKPDGIEHNDRISIVPFLDKNDPEQRATLSKLFLEANFFLFPTLREAAAIVLCEASAHGLPSIVRNTGGLASVIIDGQNGYLLSESATGKDFSTKIQEILADKEGYANLVRGSRQSYEERLSWDVWGKTVKPLFDRIVRSNPGLERTR